MLRATATWWDSVELWLTQLAFPLQVMLVVAVVGPACWGLAAVIDRVVERSVAAQLEAAQRRRHGPVDEPTRDPTHEPAP